MQILQHQPSLSIQQQNLPRNKQATKNYRHQHNKLKNKILHFKFTKNNEHPHHKNTPFNHTEPKSGKNKSDKQLTLAVRIKTTNLGLPSSSILGRGGGGALWNCRDCIPFFPLASTTRLLLCTRCCRRPETSGCRQGGKKLEW